MLQNARVPRQDQRREKVEKLTCSGDGQVERFNRVIADTISKYCAEKPQEWDLYLPHVNFVYNTTVHKTLGTTPFSMLYGREAQHPIDLFNPKPPRDPRLELGEVGAALRD